MDGDKLNITVQLFAQARDAVGASETHIEVQAGTLQTVIDSIPELQRLAVPCAYAVNGKIVGNKEPITDNCTIAVLPPVSGG